MRLLLMLKIVLNALILAFFSTALFAGDRVSIQTATGEVEVAKNPQKVAVLDLGVLENLEAIGVKAGAVNDSLYSAEKEKRYKETPRVGTLHEPNVEKLISYQPDLIIIASRSAKYLDVLTDIAPTIDLSIKGDDLISNTKARLHELGKLFDKTDKASAVAQTLDEQLTEVNRLTQNKGNALFVLTMGKKLSTYGKQSRFGWIHRDLGIPEAVKGIKVSTHGQPVSFEFIKEANPDWLIIFDRASAIGKAMESANTVLDNTIVAETTAWKNGQVIHIDPSIYLAIGGITGIKRTIDNIIKAYKKAG